MTTGEAPLLDGRGTAAGLLCHPVLVTDPTPGQHPDDRACVDGSAGASAKHCADGSGSGAEADDHPAAAEHHHLVGDSAAEWDQRYAGVEQVWSGRPNAALVSEVTGLEPGRALDVGCGEGADAVWLALHGWQVTALDVSRVALDRAAIHARDAGAQVVWVAAGLLDAQLPAAAFDLVSAQYPALRRTRGNDAELALLAAVAPGGTLLVVHHALDVEQAEAHGSDPADYVAPSDISALLGAEWEVEVDEIRARAVPAGAVARHTQDVVLRARRHGRPLRR